MTNPVNKSENNEPVAWMNKIDINLVIKKPCEERKFNWIPLYTHPVDKSANEISALIKLTGEYRSMMAHPAKTLTDEEIKQIFQEQTGFFFDDNPADDLALMDFAKAILKKAGEK